MLINLSIQDYAVVDQLEVDLEAGMTCITGETGAGKSIMLDALGLCIGDRADSRAIRPGAPRTDIAACFDVSQNTRAQVWLSERDLEAAGDCILRRTITAEGRSRAYINGSPATLSDCADLGQLLVDIHSQHAHQSLLRRPVQRSLLDTYAGAETLIVEVSETAQRWRVLQEEYSRLAGQTEESDARRALLTYQIEELETLNPQPGELEALEAQHKLLANAAYIIDSANDIAARSKALATLATLEVAPGVTVRAVIDARAGGGGDGVSAREGCHSPRSEVRQRAVHAGGSAAAIAFALALAILLLQGHRFWSLSRAHRQRRWHRCRLRYRYRSKHSCGRGQRVAASTAVVARGHYPICRQGAVEAIR